jgi:uncharacterized protein (TIGR02597 family)
MKTILRLIGCSLLVTAAEVWAQSGSATIAATPAAGYYKLTARGASDSFVSIPMVQQSSLISHISAVTPNSVTLSAFGVADGAFAPSANAVYYLQFTSGNLAGLCYEIAGNSGDIVTLNTKGDDLTNHLLGAVNLGDSGDLVRIRAFWTIGAVFSTDPTQILLAPISGFNGAIYSGGDAILLPDNTSMGFPKPPANTVNYLTGSGWRSPSAPTVDASLVELWPGVPFIIRRQASSPVTVPVIGYVSADPLTVSIPAVTANTDLSVSLVYPVPVALANSGLFGTTRTVISPSADALHLGDQVLTFSIDRQGFSPPPEFRFYVAGGHWFETAASADQIQLQPDTGYILRLNGAHPPSYWFQLPPTTP